MRGLYKKIQKKLTGGLKYDYTTGEDIIHETERSCKNEPAEQEQPTESGGAVMDRMRKGQFARRITKCVWFYDAEKIDADAVRAAFGELGVELVGVRGPIREQIVPVEVRVVLRGFVSHFPMVRRGRR